MSRSRGTERVWMWTSSYGVYSWGVRTVIKTLEGPTLNNNDNVERVS